MASFTGYLGHQAGTLRNDYSANHVLRRSGGIGHPVSQGLPVGAGLFGHLAKASTGELLDDVPGLANASPFGRRLC